MGYGGFKDLDKRTAAEKVLRDNAFNIAKNLKYDGYQHRLASMVYKFFDRKNSGGAIKKEIVQNKPKIYTNQLLENLRKQKDTHLL